MDHKLRPQGTKNNLTNITFPLSFFQAEVREGFYVSTMMKRYWASQLKVLSFVASVCEKHDIPWFADCGTLLGAVRHGGFVPWDDDLDICMLRDDWERFFEVAAKELPEGFQVLTMDIEPEYDQIIGRIVNSHAIDFGPEHMAEFYGCPYTVGIDIFPLDGLHKDQETEQKRVAKTRKILEELEQTKVSGLRKKLLAQVQNLYREVKTKDAEKVALMPFYISAGNHIYGKELFQNIVRLPFETTYMNVPARYEEVLEIEYGDYMRLVKGGGVHEYPVYADQERMLREHFGHNPYRYTWQPPQLLTSVQRYVQRVSNAMMQDAQKNVTKDACEDVGNVKQDNNGKMAVFLPVRAKWWNTMEPLWRAYSENPEYEVHVLPIFYYDCDYAGNVYDKHDERALFPEYVYVEDCEKFDFEGIHPDVIVTQIPFDGNNTAMTVHQFFYSGNLQKFTDELVYVPFLDMDAPVDAEDKSATATKTFIEQEGVINADKIVVKDKALRDFYVESLVELTGVDTAAYWNQKVQVLEDVGKEAAKCEVCDDAKSNMEWNNFLGEYAGRKVIVYHITMGFLLRGREKSIEKIRRSLKIFEEAGDKICAIILPQEQILTDLEKIDPDLWLEFCKITETIKESNCIYDKSGFSLGHMDKWNGYYGDAAPLIRECVHLGIPVMIENIDV